MNCTCCCKKLTLKARSTYYKGRNDKPVVGVYECPKCGAVMGQCYRGEAWYIVDLGRWAGNETPTDSLRYFDLTVLGSNGIERVHGWFDVTTRRVAQFG
jgi:hypothetical protein